MGGVGWEVAEVKNYLEEGDRVEGDWTVRNPEKIQAAIEIADRLNKEYAARPNISEWYAGVAHALRWALCATTMPPVPMEEQ